MSDTCWFDYIGKPFDEKKILFAKAYAQAYREQYARRIDANQAPYICPIPGMKSGPYTGPKNDKHWGGLKYWTVATVPESRWDFNTIPTYRWKQLIKGMKAADSIGCPYNFYCSITIKAYAERQWEYLPHPQHMYDPEMIEYVADLWERHIEHHVELPCPTGLERYGQRFVGYLMRIVNARRHPRYIVRHLLDKGYLELTAAELLFGRSIATAATQV